MLHDVKHGLIIQIYIYTSVTANNTYLSAEIPVKKYYLDERMLAFNWIQYNYIYRKHMNNQGANVRTTECRINKDVLAVLVAKNMMAVVVYTSMWHFTIVYTPSAIKQTYECLYYKNTPMSVLRY